MKRNGSVLVGLLWCFALVSIVVVGALYNARLDLLVVKNYGDQVQARYIALAGIEKAKALLYHDTKERMRGVASHSGALYDSSIDFRDVTFGRGDFRVFRQAGRDGGGKVVYGIADEESRLNLNQASSEELGKLYGMTPDVIASIKDWKDNDNSASNGGAEAEYYASLQPPYLPRNGPFQTVRELLMVRGVTRELFKNEDDNLNGLLDPEEDDGNEISPPDNHDGVLDAGWSGLLTVDSSVPNENAAGEPRVNIQEADEKALTAVKGITAPIARALVAYRNQRKFENLADLLEATNVPAAGQPAGPGARVIDEQLFLDIADDITVQSETELAGMVNINTASSDVLACLPGITKELADAIISYRKSAGFFPNIAWLLKVDGITRDIFKQVAPKVTARSATFRILSEGRVRSTGARKRIEMIVRPTTAGFQTLAYREDL